MGANIYRCVRGRSDQSHHVETPLALHFTYHADKVVMTPSWGESAGAISVALHMVTNGGNPDGLFRAAFMEGGSPIPVGDITGGKPYYDAFVAETGCSGATDTIQYLREVPYETLLMSLPESLRIR